MPELNRAQFTDIWHGTTAEHAEEIRRTALNPSEWNEHVMTVAYDRRTAEDYAHDAADYYEDNPALVHMRVPDKEWTDKYLGDHEEHGWGVAAGLKQPVPGKYVHEIVPLEKRPGGYYKSQFRYTGEDEEDDD